jgi:hypothetical protein
LTSSTCCPRALQPRVGRPIRRRRRNLAGNFVTVHKGNHRHQLQQYSQSTMLISLTVGKVDAGVAVLLTKDKRLVWTSELRADLRSRSPLYDSLADDSSLCTD